MDRTIFVREPPELFVLAAKWIRGLMNSALGQGQCAIALAGGTSPRPVYERLASAPLVSQVDWTRVDVYFGDERAVPPHDKDSNYRMAQESILHAVPVPPSQVHRMEAEHPDLEAAARDYERILPAALDVLVLGLGADGHTASIFPGSDALHETERRVVPVTSPKPPPRRLTITPPVIEAARAIVVIATGAEKAEVVARVLGGAAQAIELPIQLALRGAWFLDPAAGALLRDVT